ncbi:uncharacterized protein LOC135849366 [Planococcus citri]|uniref:uncharacterized protein LOC135849366 n=1 Tax=Planococcus citri TaxID=170843 RepID=UPI0031F892EE
MNRKMVGTFCRIIILLSVVSNTTACTGGSGGASVQSNSGGMGSASIQANIYDPSYITPLVEQCILFDLEALLTSSMQLTPAQEAIIRCYYSYCKNIINMAKLVATLPPSPGANGPSGGTNTLQNPGIQGVPPPATIPDPSVSLTAGVGPPPAVPDPSAGVSASLGTPSSPSVNMSANVGSSPSASATQ